jgi:predicted peroxiredoxin
VARRVVSILSGAPAALADEDPVLEANVYAVAEDVDLVLLLRGAAVEYAVVASAVPTATLADHPLPDARCARDLRGLLESGVAVHIDAVSAEQQGVGDGDLIPGVSVAGSDEQLELLERADAVLHW